MAQKSMIDPDGRFAAIVEPVVHDSGCQLVRVSLMPGRQGRQQTLQVLIEPTEGGHTPLDKCVEVSRSLSALMDVEDPVRGKYVLEVSSPGMSRPLTRFSDFSSQIGNQIKLELKHVNDDGRKRFRGTLSAVNEDETSIQLTLDNDEGDVTFAFNDLSMAKLLVDEDMIRAALNQSETQLEN